MRATFVSDRVDLFDESVEQVGVSSGLDFTVDYRGSMVVWVPSIQQAFIHDGAKYANRSIIRIRVARRTAEAVDCKALNNFLAVGGRVRHVLQMLSDVSQFL